MKKNSFLFAKSALALLLSTGFAGAQVQQIAIGGYYYPYGVSDEGIVSVQFGNDVLLWSEADGLVNIGGTTNGNAFAGRPKISADGTKVAAAITNPDTNLNEIALYDTATQVWTFAGTINGTSFDGSAGSAWDISADGTTIVGLNFYSGSQAHAVQWDAVNGMVDLGTMFTGASSRANSVSEDKTVVVGWQDLADGSRVGARWVNGEESLLTNTAGANIGEAGAVSADGTRVVGANGIYPYIWDETEGYQTITHPNSGTFYRGSATGISGDGTKIIGYFRPWPGAPMNGEGFIWTAETGRVSLNDYVTSLGYDDLGITFALPLGISKDGTKIVGTGIKGADVVGFFIDTATTLGVQQTEVSPLSVYPNPAKDILNIKAKNITGVEIYNLVGQKVSAVKSADKVDVSGLSKGVYLIKVTAEGKTQTTKFIKE